MLLLAEFIDINLCELLTQRCHRLEPLSNQA